MADWNTPASLSTAYADVLTDLTGRDVDSITLQVSAPSNLPTGAIKWNRASNKFQEWNGSTFVDMVLSVAGGGTGSATASGARTALGLGTMAVQDSSAVTITGGSISGVSVAASVLTSGTVALARGGTGASLSIGASGTVLQSNGAAVVFGTDGSGLTTLNGTNISSGTIAAARLGSGGAGAGAKFLADDQTFKTIINGWTILTKSGNYTVTAADINTQTIIECSAALTLTLPTANNGSITTPAKGLRVVVTGSGLITIAPAGGTIIGAASFLLGGQYSSLEVFPNATANDWRIF